jgi:shikimate kinase
MKHCGKSTHGRALAQHWQCAFSDTDDLIQGLNFERTGFKLSSRSIYNKYGEDYFRSLEAEVIKELAENSNDSERQVIALGGGVPSNTKVGDALEKLGYFVYLQVKPEIIFKRIVRKGLPAFLQGDNPYEKFIELYRKREKDYLNYADLTIKIDSDTPAAETARIIIETIEEKLNERQCLR